ncbi:hypothetical protein ABEB36_010196 [Hypothenemus hampei]|uniref:Uncharacterized protein n=1 Tax=Hypothenemus hampei TaxID=57062 RepID=A0ABD1EJA9_HYPHA
MAFKTVLSVVFTLFSVQAFEKSGTISDLYKIVVSIKQCLSDKYPAVCLKERALEALNETVYLDEPILIGYIRVERNLDYNWNNTKNEPLPDAISKRSIVLNDALFDKLQEFLKSRTIKLNVDEAIEGRKKGGGGGGGGGSGGKGKGMMMMAAAAACMGAGMMVGKMGMMAMAAMMLSKISLLLSVIMLLKKSKGGGGGDEGKDKQIKIIYATSGGGGDYGKGGGGGGSGGWHRSINQDPQTITYKAHIPQDVNANVIYEGY